MEIHHAEVMCNQLLDQLTKKAAGTAIQEKCISGIRILIAECTC